MATVMDRPGTKRSGSGRAEKALRVFKRQKLLHFMIFAPLLYFLIFRYIPMYGIIIAFKDYSIAKGILGSPWVGLENFSRFLNLSTFVKLIRNTVLMNVYGLLWGFPLPIVLAIFINEVHNTFYRRFIQTVSYLPHFLSTVAVVSMVMLFFSPQGGFINVALQNLFGMEPYYFMGDPKWFRTLYIGSGIWQGAGWGAIIYFAALSKVDQEMYEAATIDGASRLRKIWHISLPAIKPTIVMLLVLSLGSLLSSSAEKIILMYSPATYETADVIASYVYRRGLQNREFGYGTAVGLMNSVINFCILMLANSLSKKYLDQGVI